MDRLSWPMNLMRRGEMCPVCKLTPTHAIGEPIDGEWREVRYCNNGHAWYMEWAPGGQGYPVVEKGEKF